MPTERTLHPTGVMFLGDLFAETTFELASLPGVDRTTDGRIVNWQLVGDAAWTAMAAGRLGTHPRILAGIGSDPAGQEILAELRAQGVDTGFVVVQGLQRTSEVLILNAPGGTARIHVDHGRTPDADLVRSQVHDANPATLVLLGSWPWEVWAAARAAAPDATLIDATASLDTFQVRLGTHSRDQGAVQIIRGAESTTIVTGSETRELSLPMVPVVDPTASQAAFVGALAGFLATNFPLDRAIYLANAASAVTAGRPGAVEAMPTRRDLELEFPWLFEG